MWGNAKEIAKMYNFLKNSRCWDLLIFCKAIMFGVFCTSTLLLTLYFPCKRVSVCLTEPITQNESQVSEFLRIWCGFKQPVHRTEEGGKLHSLVLTK